MDTMILDKHTTLVVEILLDHWNLIVSNDASTPIDAPVNAEIISCKASGDQNYCSIARMIKVNFYLKSGITVVRSFFVKSAYKDSTLGKLADEYDMFKTELWMYETVLMKMKKIMNEMNDFRPTLWPQYAGGINNECIVLEDLGEIGYCNMNQTLDLDQSLRVMSEIGRFHALTMSLFERRIVFPGDFHSYRPINGVFVNNVSTSSIRYLGVAMQKSWGPEWHEAGKRVHAASERVVSTLNDLFNLDQSHPKFHAVNHGDLWLPNMLFKLGKPAVVKFVDFALAHYNTIAADLTYFLYSSVNPQVRRKHYNQLLEKYRSSLIDNMNFFGLDESLGLTFDELNEEMRRLHFFALATLSSLYLAITSDVPINRDAMYNGETADRKTWTPEHHSNEKYKIDVEDDIKLFLERNVV